MGRNRTNAVYFMVSDEEAAILDKKCQDCGMTRSQYLRYIINNIQPKVIPAIADDTHHQLLKIGNNINQIAKRLNSGDNVSGKAVTEAMASLKTVIADIRKEMISGDGL